MKKNILLIILICLLSNTLYSQDFWEEIPSNNLKGKRMDMDIDGKIYMAAQNTEEDYSGIFTWRNNETGWDTVFKTPNAINAVHAATGKVYFGLKRYLVRSQDAGQSWDTVHESVDNVLKILESNSGTVYACSQIMCRSTDDCQSWDTLFAPCLSIEFIYDMIELSPDTLIAGTVNWMEGGGVYRTSDGGQNWDWVLQNRMITCLDQTSNGWIYAGSNGDYQPYGRIYRSKDRGASWEEVFTIFEYQVGYMTVSPNDVVYFGANNGGVWGGIYRSFDYGETWELIESENIGNTTSLIDLMAFPDGYVYTLSISGFDRILYRSSEQLYEDIQTKKVPEFKVCAYPNPASEQLTVEFANTDDFNKSAILQVYNINGLLMHEEKLQSSQTQSTLDVSTWNGGMHVARLLVKGSRYGSVKFLVRN
ncbi:MAG: T9SS type A sorting domain-containing protein [Bacteroidales bacterium]|nr:T9SS type A sorting domain-containing protein [Bacteroidales bacterium]